MNYTDSVRNAILSAAHDYSLFDFGSGVRGVLLALSGGSDSVTLLHFLAEFSDKYGFSLECAHLNHHLRGDAADGDMNFCAALCEKYRVKLHIAHSDVASLARERGIGVEEAARGERYAFFDRIIGESATLSKIATAHNANDNAETVIFNLVRGGGANGLSGIAPVRGNIIRPLIYAKKADIIGFTAEAGLEYVTDATNSDTAYTRNFIRAEIIPRLAEILPSAVDTVTRASRILRDENEFVALEAAKFIDGGVTREALAEAPAALCRAVIAEMYRRASGDSAEFTHIEKTRELILSDNARAEVDFPNGFRAVIDRRTIRFEKKDENRSGVEYETAIADGRTAAGGGEIVFSSDTDFKNIYNLSIYTAIASDKIKGNLIARSRKNGDAYRIRGMTKSLRRLYCERKLTKEEKDALPVVCDGGGVIWIPGFPAADRVAPSADKENIAYLGFIPKDARGRDNNGKQN